MPSKKVPRREERAEQYTAPTYTELMSRIRRNLLRVREANGWTQEMTAHRCGMLLQTYQPIEAGKTNITMTTVARLADGLGVDPADLLTDPKNKKG